MSSSESMEIDQQSINQSSTEQIPSQITDQSIVVDEDDLDGQWKDLLDATKYRFVKRTPLRPPTNRSDLYITTTINHRAIINRSIKLLFNQSNKPSTNQSSSQSLNQSNNQSIEYHALGKAIPKAIDCALMLTGQLQINQSTSQSIKNALNQSTDQPPNQSVKTSKNQSISDLIGHYLPFSPTVFDVSMRTDSVTLIDEYLPIQSNSQSVNQTVNQSINLPIYLKRINSSIHIKISLTESARNMLKSKQPVSQSTNQSTSQSNTQYNNRSNQSGSQSNRGRGGRSSRGDSSQPWKKQKR